VQKVLGTCGDFSIGFVRRMGSNNDYFELMYLEV
jgi:hypothetical protein